MHFLIGKTIAHVVMTEGIGPFAQLFLVFTDGTYYGFYSDEPISGGGRPYGGGLAAVLARGKSLALSPPATARGVRDRAELEAFVDGIMVANLRDKHVAAAEDYFTGREPILDAVFKLMR